jgi:protein-disulfide isomerase
MKKVIFFAMLASLVFVCGCSKGNTLTTSGSLGGPSGPQVIATINGNPIKAEELDGVVKKQMQRIETQVYQIKKQGLEELIDDKLIETAAKKKGQTVDEYLKEEVDAKTTEPSEQEVKALYEARKGKDTLPFEKVKDQVLEFLKQNKKSRARQELIAKLRNDADIKVLLEPPRTQINIDNAPSMGPKDAKITLVEFSDYQCPFCKRARPTVWKLVEDYKDKIRYIFQDFPLAFHQYARKAHEAARCAGEQNKYFDYNRKLFDNQGNLAADDLKKYARELKLDAAKFDKCLDTGKYAKTVEDSMNAGIEAGVTGTPAFFVNGIMISGAQPISAFKEIIEDELKK